MSDEELNRMREKIKSMSIGHLCLSIQLTRASLSWGRQTQDGKPEIILIELLREAGERGLIE